MFLIFTRGACFKFLRRYLCEGLNAYQFQGSVPSRDRNFASRDLILRNSQCNEDNAFSTNWSRIEYALFWHNVATFMGRSYKNILGGTKLRFAGKRVWLKGVVKIRACICLLLKAGYILIIRTCFSLKQTCML